MQAGGVSPDLQTAAHPLAAAEAQLADPTSCASQAGQEALQAHTARTAPVPPGQSPAGAHSPRGPQSQPPPTPRSADRRIGADLKRARTQRVCLGPEQRRASDGDSAHHGRPQLLQPAPHGVRHGCCIAAQLRCGWEWGNKAAEQGLTGDRQQCPSSCSGHVGSWCKRSKAAVGGRAGLEPARIAPCGCPHLAGCGARPKLSATLLS